MRVFVAGATGAVGRPLIRRLLIAGHEVAGMTRSPHKVGSLEEAGARPFIADALDPEAVNRAIAAAKPDVVIDQLTDLPQRFPLRGMGRVYRRQNRVRTRGSANLQQAARRHGVQGLIAQSVAFLYAPNGGAVKTEGDPIWSDAPSPFGPAMAIAAANDMRVVESTDFAGTVLRYGVFYGPGTHFAPGNGVYEDIRRRRMPIVGDGAGLWSFIHVDDAAAATVAALEREAGGIFNIVESEPAPYRDWVPCFAEAIGAPPPRRVPAGLARLVAGPAVTFWATKRPGASGAKAKSVLGFEPATSWRDGLGGPGRRGR